MSDLIVLSGPSGVGKSTVTERLIDREPRIERSRSVTTRSERLDDDREKQYDYLSKEAFERKIDQGDFLEWAEVYGDYYGTPFSELDRIRDLGHVPLLEIDVQGGRQIRETGVEHLSIFLEPPTFDVLRKRLKKRGTNRPEELEERLEVAREEMDEIPAYDFRIVNDELPSVVNRILHVIYLHITSLNGKNHGT